MRTSTMIQPILEIPLDCTLHIKIGQVPAIPAVVIGQKLPTFQATQECQDGHSLPIQGIVAIIGMTSVCITRLCLKDTLARRTIFFALRRFSIFLNCSAFQTLSDLNTFCVSSDFGLATPDKQLMMLAITKNRPNIFFRMPPYQLDKAMFYT